MRNALGVAGVLLAVVLMGSGELYGAERGRGRSSDAEWYADPQRGWIRSDDRRDRKDERKENRKDNRSDQKDRDRGRNRGSDY